MRIDHPKRLILSSFVGEAISGRAGSFSGAFLSRWDGVPVDEPVNGTLRNSDESPYFHHFDLFPLEDPRTNGCGLHTKALRCLFDC
jgi:hypothetical protein